MRYLRAAQWQLVKEDNKRTIIERSFVYNKDGRVTVQARGDKAYAYVYRLQYINDGIETEEYFPAGSSNVSAQEELVDENNTTRFVIKQAADGSVYLIQGDKHKLKYRFYFKCEYDVCSRRYL